MTEFRKQVQGLSDPEGLVALLELSNPNFSETMRVANDVEDFVSNGVTYVGIPFSYRRPDDSTGEHPTMSLTIDNVGTAITEELEALLPNDDTYAKLIFVSRARPDKHEHIFWLPVVAISVTQTTATASASVMQRMQQKAGKLVANPFTVPGIF